mgnify:FL=1
MKNKTDWKRTVLSVLFLILAILTEVLAVYFELRDTGRLVAQMGTAVCLAISLILMFGEEGTEKVKKLARRWKNLVENIRQKVVRIFSSLFNRGIGGKSTGFIKGYRETSVKVAKNRRNAGYRYGRPYKEMNPAERIRYYYGKFIMKQMRKGYAFLQTDTAWETGEKLKQQGRITETAGELFAVYNEARYNIQAEITTEDVEKAKKIYRNPRV